MKLTTRLTLLFLSITLASISLYYFLFKLPQESAQRALVATQEVAHKIADEFQRIFGFTPEILVCDSVLIGASMPILELATVSRSISAQTSYGEKDAMTSYSVIVKGNYVVKAGYDLRKRFRITVTEKGILAEFPEPQILSVELVDYEIIKEGGTLDIFWKQTSKQAIQEVALKHNKERALQAVDSAGILNEAQEQLLLQTQPVFERVSDLHKSFSIRFYN